MNLNMLMDYILKKEKNFISWKQVIHAFSIDTHKE